MYSVMELKLNCLCRATLSQLFGKLRGGAVLLGDMRWDSEEEQKLCIKHLLHLQKCHSRNQSSLFNSRKVPLIFFGIFLGLEPDTSADQSHHSLNSEFSHALTVPGYPHLSLKAVPRPHTDTLLLIFEAQSADAGTRCDMNSTHLNLRLETHNLSSFAMYVPWLGNYYGLASPVLANLGRKNGGAGYVLAGGQLAPLLHSGAKYFFDFFACNGTVNGEDALVLVFGVFNGDGASRTFCVAAMLIRMLM
ncbi:hypothetical protein NHQ30_000910 [Ciborinia camelliae]|nr:hypothetical protein NHQ30_000910 [Ciborinia camelliae]